MVMRFHQSLDKMIFKKAGVVTALLSVTLMLSACSIFESKDKQPPLPGERISALQMQKDLEPDPVLQASGMQMPETWQNQFWPQAGGYPSHAMGHLALGENLKRLWRVDIGDAVAKGLPLITQPVVADGMIFAMDIGATLSAYKTADGKKLWSRKLAPKKEETESLGGGLAFAGGRLYVTTGYRDVIALDPQTGNDIWRQTTPAPTRSAPAVLGGRVFIVTLDNRVIVYNEEDGTVLWQYVGAPEVTNLLGATSPALDRSLAVVALSSGELIAFRAENGQTLWVDNLAARRRGGGALGSISDIKGLPIIHDGIVYAVSFSGRIVAIDERTGQRIWQREIGGAQTPWTAGDAVYLITADRQLVALSRQTGGIYWTVSLPAFRDMEKREDAITWFGPLLAGGRLIMASDDGDVLEYDPLLGKPLKRYDVGGRLIGMPIVADGMIYFLTQDGDLLAYQGQ
jgi:outer membrane protein assembly factor BamB